MFCSTSLGPFKLEEALQTKKETMSSAGPRTLELGTASCFLTCRTEAASARRQRPVLRISAVVCKLRKSCSDSNIWMAISRQPVCFHARELGRAARVRHHPIKFIAGGSMDRT
mgnify:CR=1 FL=1